MSTPALHPAARPPGPDALDALHARLDVLERRPGVRAIAVAVHDTASHANFRRHAERWFHAASTIKVAILLGVYSAIHHGWLLPHSRLHVRNRFFSAVDGQTFRVLADRDANSEVHETVGKMMRISDLALRMIATSSNLATNLLLDLVGIETVQRALDELHLDGIDIRRGVEDERAFSSELSREMLGILHAQEFRNGIPARLPPAVRVAHKTGDISTVAHDAGVVYPPRRKPYVIAVLTEWEPEAVGRSATIAEISHAVYELLTGDTSPGPEPETIDG